MFKYVIIVAIGAISYGALTSFAKIAYNEGYSAAEITFAQAFLGALVLWLLTATTKKSAKVSVKSKWKLVIAGAAMGCSAYCFYLSVKFIPVSLSIVLLMQVSWISNLAECILFKRKPLIAEFIASLMIILGTTLAGNLIGASGEDVAISGVVLALAAACFYTVYVLATSKLGNELPKLQKSALMTSGSALMILMINLPSITSNSHFDIGLLKWGSLLAIFGTVIPPICFTIGMPKIGPSLSGILLTLELPAVVLCAHLILKEPITGLQLSGIGVMITAIIYLNLATAKFKV